ncbi:MAG: formyltransferase family protein [Bacteroidetes bacterium]|nr:formyltransferase family protein [Bacteroidota bacterium]
MTIGVVSGSKNCLPLLQFLKANKVNVVLYTDNNNRMGSDFEIIYHYCASVNIAIENTVSIYVWCEANNLDFMFVLGYSQLINITKINSALLPKTFNIHFGSLPEFKGPNPLFWQIKTGAENATLCIHRLNEKFDDGDVVWTKAFPFETHFTFGFLELLFSQTLIEGVIQLISQQTTAAPQNKSQISKYYKRPLLHDVTIDWEKMNAQQILRLVNACNPWNKGATTFYNYKEVKIIDVKIVANTAERSQQKPGTILQHEETVLVLCKNNELLKIGMLNINGTFVPARHAHKLGITSGGIFAT